MDREPYLAPTARQYLPDTLQKRQKERVIAGRRQRQELQTRLLANTQHRVTLTGREHSPNAQEERWRIGARYQPTFTNVYTVGGAAPTTYSPSTGDIFTSLLGKRTKPPERLKKMTTEI